MKPLSLLLYLTFWALEIFAQNDTAQKATGAVNAVYQQHKPYVILISADGFRYNYAMKYHAAHLLELAGSGVTAAAMIPSFPSVTFPNHYTLITGLYPAHNGIVNNSFFDRKRNQVYSYRDRLTTSDGSWYGGTPLWVLAENEHLLSATYYWVGSEAAIRNSRPAYYYTYNEQTGPAVRIKAVVDWLKSPSAQRPHFITFYLPQVDHAGHIYGADAPQTQQQVRFIDSIVYELTEAVKKTGLPVNYIFVSDHGMTTVDTARAIGIPQLIDTSKFRVMGDGTLVELYARQQKDILPAYTALKESAAGFSVYLRGNMPDYLHYSKKDDWYNRIGDILLIPKWPLIFNLYNRKVNPGAHGYDPLIVKDMLATFYAWGPAFKRGLTMPAFNNTEVYPVILKILGLKEAPPTDATGKISRRILINDQ